jgi:hypothetical protein
MAIDNNANWTSRIKGNATLGAAFLAPDEFKRLAFIVRRTEAPNLKFNLSVSCPSPKLLKVGRYR